MEKSIKKNIFFKFILNLFNLIVPILVGPYIMRKLTPDQMGELNFAQSIIGYFFIFASFGVYQYGLREISKVKNNKSKLSKKFTSLFVTTLITNIVSLILYLIVAKIFYGKTAVYPILLMLSFDFISNIFYVEWVNEAIEKFDFITIKSIIVRGLYVFFIFLIIKSSNNYKQYIILILISNFLSNILSYIYVRKHIKFTFSDLDVFVNLKPMLLVVILTNTGMLYTQLDRFMLGQYVNKLQVAYYSTGQNIMRIINILLLTFVQATIPRLTSYSYNDDENYKKLLNQIIRIYMLLLFPTSMGMLLLSKEIVVLYGGINYLAAGSTLSIFAIYMITLGYENIFSNQILYIKGKEIVQIKIAFLGGLLNLVLNSLCTYNKIFNANTAIITTLISNVVMITIEYIYIIKILEFKVKILSKNILIYIISSMLFIPIILLIKLIIKNNIFVIGLSVIACSIIYFLLLVIFKDDLVISIVNNLKKKSCFLDVNKD